MATPPRRIDVSDRPAVWAVVGFTLLAVAINGFMFLLPKLAQSLKGETVLGFMVFAGVMCVVGVAVVCVGLALGWIAARNASASSVRRYIRAVRIPIAIVLGTAAIGAVLDSEGWPLWALEGIRALAAALAGWSLARYGFSLWKCAVSGVLLLFLDHVVVKTIAFALTFEWLAIGGVFISFAMFAFVPMAIAAAAGFLAKRIPPSNSTVESDAREAARGSP